MTQDELKAQVGQAAVQHIVPLIESGACIGVGTGSTVNHFIAALAPHAPVLRGAVSSSSASTERLLALGIPVLSCQEAGPLAVYVDGADEIDPQGCMIKGGGAALTREKIVAAHARSFICIADDSKWVNTLGAFPLPIEVIPMATAWVIERCAELGGSAQLRLRDGQPLVTDNGQHIVDVRGLPIFDPLALEMQMSQWPGVVTVGIFAVQKASLCLLASAGGVKQLRFA